MVSKKEINLKYGNRLKALRDSLKLNQGPFADELGVSRNTIVNYECGKTFFSVEFIEKVLRQYNVNLTWLVTGEGDIFKNENIILPKEKEAKVLPKVFLDLEVIYKNNSDFQPVLEAIVNDPVFRGYIGASYYASNYRKKNELKEVLKDGRQSGNK